MKEKLLLVGAGTCAVLVLCAAGSGFLPSRNLPVALYGPPPIESSSREESSPRPGESEESTEKKTDPTEQDIDFDPSENIPVPLYGPPPAEPSVSE